MFSTPLIDSNRMDFESELSIQHPSFFHIHHVLCCAVLCLVTQSCPTLYDPWNIARRAQLSMGFSRQEYWNGLPCRPPGDLPIPGFKPSSPTLWQIFYHLSHQRSPRVLEWIAIPCPGDLPDLGIEHGSPALQADSLPAELPEKPYTHHTFLQFSPLNAFENYCFSS